MDVLDTKFNYLIVKMIYSADTDMADGRNPVAVIRLDTEFFEWVDARRALVLSAHELRCVRLLFHANVEYANGDIFDPGSYEPDGEDDVEDTEKMKATLAPMWEALDEGDGFFIVSGQTLDELGLSEPEDIEDYRTGSDYFALRVDTVFKEGVEPKEWEKRLGLIIEADEKHTYEAWNSHEIDYDKLRAQYRESALAVFTVKPG